MKANKLYKNARRKYKNAKKILRTSKIEKMHYYKDKKKIRQAGVKAWHSIDLGIKFLFENFGYQYYDFCKDRNRKKLTDTEIREGLEYLAQKTEYQEIIMQILRTFSDLYIGIYLEMVHPKISSKKVIDINLRILKNFLRSIKQAVNQLDKGLLAL